MTTAKSKTPRKTAAQKRMIQIVADFQNYVATYSDQAAYETYRDETFIDDMLYGIGIALDKSQYRMGDGFEKFKARLHEHTRDQWKNSPLNDELSPVQDTK